MCCASLYVGTKALSKIHTSSSRAASDEESIAFVTVFTVYNSSMDGYRVTVGNASYSKMERSMAILNVFINFIQVCIYTIHLITCKCVLNGKQCRVLLENSPKLK